MSAALIDAPYSSPDARGRCIRHPTIQMSRKKKLGGWKKIMEHCPMCAMEQCGGGVGISGGVGFGGGDAYCGEIAPAASHGGREPSYGGDYGESSSHSGNHHSHPQQRSSRSYRPHSSRSSRPSHHYEGDDRSVDNKSLHSTRSAPSTYGSPRYHRRNSEESSCDTTVDMSQSSSSDHSGSRHSRNGSSRGAPRSGGSVHSHTSRGSRRSARSARSSNSSHRPQQRPSQQARNQISPNQEAFVCGMSYRFDNNRGYYTGQIHVESQLPHGLGSLRSEENGMIMEGEWEFGRLVASGGHPASRSPQQDYQEQEYGCQDYSEYCLPCTSNSPSNNRASNQNTPQDLCNNFGQLGLNEDSNSIAETIDDSEESDFDSSQSSADDWSKGSRNSYSARESKTALPSRNSNSRSRSSGAPSSRSASRSSASSPPHQQKLTEYASYIEQCDSSQDWYVENDSPQHSRSSSIHSSGSSASRVSFADDVKREFGSGAGRRVRFR